VREWSYLTENERAVLFGTTRGVEDKKNKIIKGFKRNRSVVIRLLTKGKALGRDALKKQGGLTTNLSRSRRPEEKKGEKKNHVVRAMLWGFILEKKIRWVGINRGV